MSTDAMQKTSSDLHGRVISRRELKQTLPSRFEILDPRVSSQVSQKLKNKEPVMFLPNYLAEINFQDQKYKAAKYKILLCGIFQDGRRATVMLDGITPYFEVKVPFEDEDGLIVIYENRQKTQITKQEYINRLRKLLDKDEFTKPFKTTQVSAKPFKYFQEENNKFIRFHYHKLKNRKAAIKLVRQNGYETASDDLSCYYRVVCRNYLTSFSSWIELTDYKASQIDRVKGMTYRVNIKNFSQYKGELKGDLLRDKTMSLVWDIETWSKSNDVPLPEDPDARIFCIGLTLQWIHEQKPFLRIALCDLPCKGNDDYLTVVCGNERNLIRTFADIFAIYQPEIIAGFNDSDYDWPWIVERAAQTKGELVYLAKKFNCFEHWSTYSDKDIMKYNYKKETVKLEATTEAVGRTLQLDGYINVDVRTIFRKLYPTAEKSSLNWFLSKNKLGGKEDMPYKRMFKIYEKMCAKVAAYGNYDYENGQTSIEYDDEEYQQLLHDYMEINKYCVVDAQRCHELLKIRNVIMDKREVSNLAYCSVHDSFYRADGMKVRNLTIAIGQDPTLPFNIRFTNISNDQVEEGKYPGAYVFPPEKGLKVSKLTIEERIEKGEKEWVNITEEVKQQYYNIIDNYGPVQNEEQITEIEILEKTKLDKRFKNFLREAIGRPITGLDFSSLYPSLIRAYNLSPEKCIVSRKFAKEYFQRTGQRLTKVEFDYNGRCVRGWFPWHNNAVDPTDKEFAFGLYPYILDKLFNMRKEMKKGLHHYAHMKEEMEAKGEEWIAANASEYEDAIFNYAAIDSKQRALKVFMNTFYGEAGNKRSPFFVLQVAGGITSYGQMNIKMAQAKVEEEGCHVYYGDSVAEYTPILIKQNSEIKLIEFQDLADNDSYIKYNNGKEIAFLDNVQIWSDIGWTDIKHVIRHRTNKQMYRILTHTSCVDVTEDHSLLTDKGEEISPNNLSTGDCIMTFPKPLINPLAGYRPDWDDDLVKNSHTSTCLFNTNSTHLTIAKQMMRRTYFGHICELQYDQNTNKFRIIGKQNRKTVKNPRIITNIIKLPATTAYVYDVETSNHHFAAGIGDIIVHNTDSIYLSVPEKSFTKWDKLYYTGNMNKLEYWTKLVETTFEVIKPLNVDVNHMFVADNGTTYLSMAYEEVLYPVMFTAKKKYFGIPHENIVNFKPKELFIRGLEVKKRGVSQLLRDIFNELMWRACSVDNLHTVKELVEAKIDEIYSRKWEMHHFLQSDVFRPKKQNIKVHTFAARMRERGITVPEHERFNYVIVKRYPYKYDYRGRKSSLSTGELMEFPEEAEKNGWEMDLDYYMKGSVNGQLGRLITYHPLFQVMPTELHDEEAIKLADEKTYKNACKYIEEYCKRYYSSYNQFGKVYQKTFKIADKIIAEKMKERDPFASRILGVNVKTDDLENWLIEFAEKRAIKVSKDYGNTFIKQRLNDVPKELRKEKIETLQRIYFGLRNNSIQEVRNTQVRQMMSVIRRRIADTIIQIKQVYGMYHVGINRISNRIKDQFKFDDIMCETKSANKFSFEDFNIDIESIKPELDEEADEYTQKLMDDPNYTTAMNDFKRIYLDLLAAQLIKARTDSIVDALKVYRDKSCRIIREPKRDVIKKTIEEALQDDEEELLALDI